MINLTAPLAGPHVFRQSQTAISVEWAASEGIRLLDYQTPIYGPPWRWPLEFPTYQATAAVLAKTGLSVEVACRIANLLFFYLSAFALYHLTRLLEASAGAGLAILLCYVFMPFTIVWSRTAMIDFAAVAFALLYSYAFCRWLKRPAGWWWAVASTAAGSLAFLTKVTTMAGWWVFLVLAAAWRYWPTLRSSNGWPRVGSRRVAALATLGLAQFVVPVLVYLRWMVHSAAVRSEGAATKTFSVLNWKRWFFSLESLTSPELHLALGRALWFLVLTAPVALLGMACVVLLRRRPARRSVLFWAASAAALAGILTHFNMLTTHDYYLVAVAPLVAMPMGIVVHEFFRSVPRGRSNLRLALAGALVVAAIANIGLGPAGRYLVRGLTVAEWSRQHQAAWREAVAQQVGPRQHLILAGTETDPRYLYFARRKGLVWRSEMSGQPAVEAMLCSYPFAAIAVSNGQGPERFPWLFSRFGSVEPVTTVGRLHLYAISDGCGS